MQVIVAKMCCNVNVLNLTVNIIPQLWFFLDINFETYDNPHTKSGVVLR